MKKSEFEQAVKARDAKKKESKPKAVRIVETVEQELEYESDKNPKKASSCDDDVDDSRGASEAAQDGGQADIKLGEIQLRPDSVLLVKKTNYNGSDRVDFRIWKNTATYKGPTKQGFVVTMEKLEEFFKVVDGMKKKLNL
jgi:hypothetical protein